jgi:spore maturation protein CgeB
MKISLVGSYNLADGYLGAANALRNRGAIVDFIPAHFYFSEFGDKDVSKIIEDLREQSPDVVLWWRSETLNYNDMQTICEKYKAKHVLFSWDDPHSWENRHNYIADKCEFFDTVFSCCESSLKDYIRNGAKEAFYLPPGFDPEVHYPEFSEEHQCDISVVCTNYYDSSVSYFDHLNRREMLEYLIARFPQLKIDLYGSGHFQTDFPDNYRGWLPFTESRKVFHNSKINISTHIRPDGDRYINERSMQIIGSGGLLLVDNVKGIENILVPDSECVVFDFRSLDDLGKEVEQIFADQAWADLVRVNGRKRALADYSWDSWAKTVLQNI